MVELFRRVSLISVYKKRFICEYQHPKYDQPKLLAPIDFDFRDKRILLVDDRIKTGSTIKLAKELMQEARMIKTFAVNGNADYALFDEACFKFPWIV